MSYLKSIASKIMVNNRIVLIGNTLEFFDLYLYIHFAVMISQKFFSPGFEKTTFFQSFTFCQIYFLAPIACIIFSYLGDKHGRKPVILHTSMLMAVTSLLITFLPTYETCGETATVLLVILRVIQGIALAGEPTAAGLYLVENSSMERDDPWYKQSAWCLKLTSVTEQGGGILALLAGWVALHYFGDHPHGWRIPFALCGVFVFFILFIRTRLSESEEYMEATSNKENINIFSNGKDGYIYLRKTMHFHKRNFWCWVLLLLTYPILFNVCFLQISPQVVGVDAPLENLLMYNVYVSIGSMIGSLICTYFPLRFKWNLKKTTNIYVFIGLFFPFLAVWGAHNSLPILFIYSCQILMMSLINFGLIMPGLLKVLPVVGRYSFMGIGWGIARFTNFFLVVLALQGLKHALGMYGCLSLLYGVVALGLFAVWYHVSYYRLDDELTLKILKESKKGSMVPGRDMTMEEIDEYIENRKRDYKTLT